MRLSRCMHGYPVSQKCPACDQMKPHQFLVACLDGNEYLLATRTVFTSRKSAELYVHTIHWARKPIIIEAVKPIPVTLKV